jgi:hypothetical protein
MLGVIAWSDRCQNSQTLSVAQIATTTQVSGVLSITGAGLLLLRRLQRLALLRLEQWTNTYNKVGLG